VNSIVACCHSAKLCAYAARAFPNVTIAFFLNQGTSSTVFAKILPKLAQISPSLPEKRKIKT